MAENTARLRLTARDETARAFRTASDNFRRFDAQVQGTIRTHERMASSASTAIMGASRNLAAGFAAIGAGGALVKAYRDMATLDRSLTRLGQKMDATPRQMAQTRQALRQIAQDIGLPLSEVQAGLNALAEQGGRTNEQMLAFLPKVAAAAQVAGASTADMAKTAGSIASQMGVTSDEMELAFDVLIQAGREGRFEMENMAKELPNLTAAFGQLGYKGVPGVKLLGALLQTIAEQTGEPAQAATRLGEIFGKMTSDEVVNNFKELAPQFGNLRDRLDEVRKNGGDVLAAFVGMTREAVNGDLSKLPLLFGDKEMRQGMLALLSQPGRIEKLFRSLGDAAGITRRDLVKLANDPQAGLERLQNSFNDATVALGALLDQAGATTALKELATLLGNTAREIERIQRIFKDPRSVLDEMAKNRADNAMRAIDQEIAEAEQRIERLKADPSLGAGQFGIRTEQQRLNRLRRDREDIDRGGAEARGNVARREYEAEYGGRDEGNRIGRGGSLSAPPRNAVPSDPGTATEGTLKSIERESKEQRSLWQRLFNRSSLNGGEGSDSMAGGIGGDSLFGGSGDSVFSGGGAAGAGRGGGFGGGGSSGAGTGGAGLGGAIVPNSGFKGAEGGKAQQIYNTLREEGLNHAQAVAFLGHAQQESTLSGKAWNRGEQAGGLIQWRGNRLANLKAFAAQRGEDWQSETTQARFFAHEQRTDPYENRMGRRFRDATTVEEATAALRPVIRYGDNSSGTRLGNARAFDRAIKPGEEPSAMPSIGADGKLRVKGAQATGGGAHAGGTEAVARWAQANIPGFNRVTAFNDYYHQGTSSKHAKGLAGDFTIADPRQSAQAAQSLRDRMRAAGLSDEEFRVIDEYRNPSSRSTGGHLHYQFSNKEAARKFEEHQRVADEARKARAELEKPVSMNLQPLPNFAPQFRRASMRRQVNREVREAMTDSYADIGAA